MRVSQMKPWTRCPQWLLLLLLSRLTGACRPACFTTHTGELGHMSQAELLARREQRKRLEAFAAGALPSFARSKAPAGAHSQQQQQQQPSNLFARVRKRLAAQAAPAQTDAAEDGISAEALAQVRAKAVLRPCVHGAHTCPHR